MLVLSRKVGERFIIDGGIRLTLVSSNSVKARIGFEAPANINIRREEVDLRAARSTSQGGESTTKDTGMTAGSGKDAHFPQAQLDCLNLIIATTERLDSIDDIVTRKQGLEVIRGTAVSLRDQLVAA